MVVVASPLHSEPVADPLAARTLFAALGSAREDSSTSGVWQWGCWRVSVSSSAVCLLSDTGLVAEFVGGSNGWWRFGTQPPVNGRILWPSSATCSDQNFTVDAELDASLRSACPERPSFEARCGSWTLQANRTCLRVTNRSTEGSAYFLSSSDGLYYARASGEGVQIRPASGAPRLAQPLPPQLASVISAPAGATVRGEPTDAELHAAFASLPASPPLAALTEPRRFGEWCARAGSDCVLFIHATGLVLELRSGSNGWWRFGYNPSSDGTIVWNPASTSRQTFGVGAADFQEMVRAASDPTRPELSGAFSSGSWTAIVTLRFLFVRNRSDPSVIAIPRVSSAVRFGSGTQFTRPTESHHPGDTRPFAIPALSAASTSTPVPPTPPVFAMPTPLPATAPQITAAQVQSPYAGLGCPAVHRADRPAVPEAILSRVADVLGAQSLCLLFELLGNRSAYADFLRHLAQSAAGELPLPSALPNATQRKLLMCATGALACEALWAFVQLCADHVAAPTQETFEACASAAQWLGAVQLDAALVCKAIAWCLECRSGRSMPTVGCYAAVAEAWSTITACCSGSG